MHGRFCNGNGCKNICIKEIVLIHKNPYSYNTYTDLPSLLFFHQKSMHEENIKKARKNRDLSVFDVVSINDLSLQDIELILDVAQAMKESKTTKLSFLKGITIVNAFYENSTRTRASFEMAGKHLGADTINISGGSSSTKKGESLIDTTATLSAYHTQIIIVRSEYSGIPAQLSKTVPSSIINAGDGWNEHPSQALLDVKTMLDHHQSLKGKIITIVGDVLHSRVFGSLARILQKLGASIRVACPYTFVPEKMEEVFGAQHFCTIEEALHNSDVVYALRVQEERGSKGFIPSLREYSKTFGITEKRLQLAKPNAILMHPGPVIRDIDVHSGLVNLHAQSHILNQVENGMAVRASLQWLLADRYDGKRKEFSPQ